MTSCTGLDLRPVRSKSQQQHSLHSSRCLLTPASRLSVCVGSVAAGLSAGSLLHSA